MDSWAPFRTRHDQWRDLQDYSHASRWIPRDSVPPAEPRRRRTYTQSGPSYRVVNTGQITGRHISTTIMSGRAGQTRQGDIIVIRHHAPPRATPYDGQRMQHPSRLTRASREGTPRTRHRTPQPANTHRRRDPTYRRQEDDPQTQILRERFERFNLNAGRGSSAHQSTTSAHEGHHRRHHRFTEYPTDRGSYSPGTTRYVYYGYAPASSPYPATPYSAPRGHSNSADYEEPIQEKEEEVESIGSDSTQVDESQIPPQRNATRSTETSKVCVDRPSRALPFTRKSNTLGHLPVRICSTGVRRIPAQISFGDHNDLLVSTPLYSMRIPDVDQDSMRQAMVDRSVDFALTEQTLGNSRTCRLEAFGEGQERMEELELDMPSLPEEKFEERWQWFLQQHRSITVNPSLEKSEDGYYDASFTLALNTHIQASIGLSDAIKQSRRRGPAHWQVQFDPSRRSAKLRFAGIGERSGKPILASWDVTEELQGRFSDLWDHYEAQNWPAVDVSLFARERRSL